MALTELNSAILTIARLVSWKEQKYTNLSRLVKSHLRLCFGCCHIVALWESSKFFNYFVFMLIVDLQRSITT